MTDNRPKVKISLRIYAEDLEALRQFFPTGGYNGAIRKMVSRLVKKLQERTNQKLSTAELSDLSEKIEVETDDD